MGFIGFGWVLALLGCPILAGMSIHAFWWEGNILKAIYFLMWAFCLGKLSQAIEDIFKK